MNRLQLAIKALTTRDSNALSIAGNLFGAIGKKALPVGMNYGFVPIDNEGHIMRLQGDVDADWLGLSTKSMQYWAYVYCSPLAAVIDKLAEADANGRIEFLNQDGTTVKNINKIPALKRVQNLLLNPNPWQTYEEYDSEQVTICKIFGYCPVFAPGSAIVDNTYTKRLYNLNPLDWVPEFNNDYSMFAGEDEPKRNNPIKLWRGNILGKAYEIPAENIMLVKDGYLNKTNEFGLPLSKVAGLDYFISNICAGMEADNVLLKKKGPLGVFTYAAKPDLAGVTPMKPGDKDDLQKDLDNYGLGAFQKQYVISKNPVKWEPMSFNVEELKIKETIRQCIDGICDRFGYPAELMSGKNATYENRSSAEQFLYQNNVIPFSLRRMATHNRFFGFNNSEYKITLDFDHLPVLQEDIMHAGQAFEALSSGLDVLWKSGLITFNDVMRRIEQDTVSGMDIYYPEWLEKNPIMKELIVPKKDNKNGDKKPKD